MHVSFYCMFLYPACYAMLSYAINAFIIHVRRRQKRKNNKLQHRIRTLTTRWSTRPSNERRRKRTLTRYLLPSLASDSCVLTCRTTSWTSAYVASPRRCESETSCSTSSASCASPTSQHPYVLRTRTARTLSRRRQTTSCGWARAVATKSSTRYVIA